MARIQSASNIYHIVMRGNNMQRIFEEREDYEKLISLLKQYKQECGFTLYAWCLMPNHIHLLLKIKQATLSETMAKINIAFVKWYNLKYERKGHLYQGRFKSEPVEDETYFLTVFRYIHMNPVKGKICSTPEDYPYSSYGSYFLSEKYQETDDILGLMRKDELRKFHREKNEDICLDVEKWDAIRLTDEEAEEIVRREIGCERISQVQSLPFRKRNQAISILLQKGGSLRQINRLTGVNIRLIRKLQNSTGAQEN